MKTVLVFDIGGTKTSHCLINQSGEIVSDIIKVHTPKTSAEIYEYLKTTIAEYDSKIDLVSIATAGCVNNENTKVSGSTPNLPAGYPDLDFSALSTKKVFIENDANAAAWAEFRTGTAKYYKHSITLTLGTGIGGGIIIDGKLLKGSQGLAGEVGSIKISYDNKRKCTCHNYDCWECYGSGTGLKKTAEELALTEKSFHDSIYANKKPEEITTYDIIEGTKKGDSYSTKVFETWHYHLFCGLVSLVNIFNPECIILSGGLGDSVYHEWLENTVNEHSVVSDVKIMHSTMKNNTGMIGAALLALEKI